MQTSTVSHIINLLLTNILLTHRLPFVTMSVFILVMKLMRILLKLFQNETMGHLHRYHHFSFERVVARTSRLQSIIELFASSSDLIHAEKWQISSHPSESQHALHSLITA